MRIIKVVVVLAVICYASAGGGRKKTGDGTVDGSGSGRTHFPVEGVDPGGTLRRTSADEVVNQALSSRNIISESVPGNEPSNRRDLTREDNNQPARRQQVVVVSQNELGVDPGESQPRLPSVNVFDIRRNTKRQRETEPNENLVQKKNNNDDLNDGENDPFAGDWIGRKFRKLEDEENPPSVRVFTAGGKSSRPSCRRKPSRPSAAEIRPEVQSEGGKDYYFDKYIAQPISKDWSVTVERNNVPRSGPFKGWKYFTIVADHYNHIYGFWEFRVKEMPTLTGTNGKNTASFPTVINKISVAANSKGHDLNPGKPERLKEIRKLYLPRERTSNNRVEYYEKDFVTDDDMLRWVGTGDQRFVDRRNLRFSHVSTQGQLMWASATAADNSQTRSILDWEKLDNVRKETRESTYFDKHQCYMKKLEEKEINGKSGYEEESVMAFEHQFDGFKPIPGDWQIVPGTDLELRAVRISRTSERILYQGKKVGSKIPKTPIVSFQSWMGYRQFQLEEMNLQTRFTVSKTSEMTVTDHKILQHGPRENEGQAFVYIMRIRGNTIENQFKVGMSNDPIRRLADINRRSEDGKAELVFQKPADYAFLAEKLIHFGILGDPDNHSEPRIGTGGSEWFVVEKGLEHLKLLSLNKVKLVNAEKQKGTYDQTRGDARGEAAQG